MRCDKPAANSRCHLLKLLHDPFDSGFLAAHEVINICLHIKMCE